MELNILGISGIAVIALGVIVIIQAVISGKRRIALEDDFIEAEGEIIRMDSKLSVQFVHMIPIISKEYRPVVCYRTADGIDIESSNMPYAMRSTPEYSELFRMYETKAPVVIHYDPRKPEDFYYYKRKGFRIREVIYKFIFAGVLIALGTFMLWGSTID